MFTLFQRLFVIYFCCPFSLISAFFGYSPTRFSFISRRPYEAAALETNDKVRVRGKHTFYLTMESESYPNSGQDVSLPPGIMQPVLQQVYPSLMAHIKDYGHPNIPLGSKEGKLYCRLWHLFALSLLLKNPCFALNFSFHHSHCVASLSSYIVFNLETR